jgi:hypothetical protein
VTQQARSTPTTETQRVTARKAAGRSNRSKRSLRLLAGTLAAGVLVGIAGTGPALASSDTAAPSACSNQVVTKAARAQLKSSAAATDLVKLFVKSAGSSTGTAAFSFAMSTLMGGGDQTSDQLNAISAQLASMDAKLDALQGTADEIKSRVNKAAFTNLMTEFKKIRSSVDSINHNGLMPVAITATHLATVKDDPNSTPEQIEQAENCLAIQQKGFRDLALKRDVEVNSPNIANLLESTAGENDLVSGYGTMLAQEHRYLTAEHSGYLQSFYSYIEQYQAMAEIQRAEWQIAVQKPTETIRQSNVEFYNEIGHVSQPGVVQHQRAAMPEEIPSGTMIDVGSNGDETIGKTMLTDASRLNGSSHHVTWREADRQGDSTRQSQATTWLDYFNRDQGKKFGDWRIVKPAEWNSLVETKKSATATADHLDTVFNYKPGKHFTTGDFVWVDKKTEHTITVKPRIHDWKTYYPVHVGITLANSGDASTTSAAASWQPGLPTETLRMSHERARQIVTERFENAKGLMLVARDVEINYMAKQ